MHVKCLLDLEAKEKNALIKDFLEDMSKFQKEDIKIKLDEEGYERFKYASLKSVINATKPLLNKHNLFFLESTKIGAEKKHEYSFVLLHKNGCYLESNYTSIVEMTEKDRQLYATKKSRVSAMVKDVCQPLGMEHTYFNRYSRCNMLGLVADNADIDKLKTDVQEVKEIQKHSREEIEAKILELTFINENIDKVKAMETVEEIGKYDFNKMYAVVERAIKNPEGFTSYYNKMHALETHDKRQEIKAVDPVTGQKENSYDLDTAIDVLLDEQAIKEKNITKSQILEMVQSISDDKQKQQDVLSNAIVSPTEFVSAMETYKMTKN